MTERQRETAIWTQLLTERNSNLNTVIDREKQQLEHSY